MQCPTCQGPLEDGRPFCPNCGAAVQPSQPPAPDAQAPDPMLGVVLGGKYKVLRLLGEGGMGAVYEGEQQLGTTKRKVAIKTLHPHLSRDAKIKARFEREVGTVAELEHPNTIQVYDFGTTPDGILYIVMEFLSGKSLADLLEKEGAMMPERVAQIMKQICGSLEEAHGRGIVHRDLKPDNVVLVDRAGQKDFVKVLDFGIAKRANEEDKNEQKLTQQGMVLGTPPYMSPEQFTGRPIDARSDIYSLGVMAYEMLTGRLPFVADTPWEWATRHMTAAPIPMEAAPEGMRAAPTMRAAVQRALAKSPLERFQTVKEFNDLFLTGFDGRASVASFAGVPPAQLMSPSPMDPSGYAVPPMGGGPAYAAPQSNIAFVGPAGVPQAAPPRPGGGLRVALIVGAVLAVLGGAIAAVVLFVLPGPAPAPAPAPPRPVPVPTHQAPPASAPPHPNTPYNGIECQRARDARAAGKVAEAKEWATACTAKGGTP
jgi:serine/threonine-protein kinase